MLIILMALLTAAAPPSPAPCSSPEYRQFDFWIGEWAVNRADGTAAGTNRISRMAGGCALLEEYASVRGYTGKSLNIYDAARGVWHQTWVDSEGLLLEIEGRLEGKAMILSSPTDRITWAPTDSTHLRQVWEQSKDGGSTWEVVFDGRYAKTK